MISEKLLWWLRLRSVKGVGPIKFNEMIRAFGGPQAVFSADRKSLSKIPRLGESSINEILGYRPSQGFAEEQLEKAAALGITILAIDDPEYPENMRHFVDAPPLLYVRGSFIGNDRRAVAIVGSRNATVYGKKASLDMAGQLATLGITVVSGMARGIDSAAHQGALDAGGRTIAVLGCGVDVVYPPENVRLRDLIIEHGAVISEYPIGERPLQDHFPNRNRIISGLSLGVLAVEAREDSGVFSTVRWAAEQGREVFAVPGPITSAASAGPNRLIKQGAKIVLDVKDILDELRIEGPIASPQAKGPKVELDDGEGPLLAEITDDPRHVDSLAESLRLAPVEIMRLLFSLEMKGLVRQMPGKMYIRA